ncbi:MAG: hypothetical protein AMXMBFR56_61990 [Polyangiaceae bacterium]
MAVKVVCWEAKTRQFVAVAFIEDAGSGPQRAGVDFGREGGPKERLEPHVARQLAHTLLAAADVAEEEAEAQRD